MLCIATPAAPWQAGAMQMAILSDIQGSADALAAVLADMDELGLTRAINLGDHLSSPLAPARIADMLMARGFASVRGNHDGWLLEQPSEAMGAADRCARDEATPAHLDWLRAMPATLTIEDVFACHRTPASDTTYWLQRVTAAGEVRAARRAEVEAGAAGIGAGLILCGRTHLPRLVRLGDGRLVLNPGSVGCPACRHDDPVTHRMQAGTPNASYAIAARGREGWRVTFRSLPYDGRRLAVLAGARGQADWAWAVTTGWVDPA